MFTVLIRCDPWGCHSRVAIFPQLKLAPETPVWWWLQAGENCHGNFATARSNSEWLRLLVSFCRQDGGHTPVTIPVGPTPSFQWKRIKSFIPISAWVRQKEPPTMAVSGSRKNPTQFLDSMSVWVPIRRATQKSDSSRFRVSGFGFRRLKPTFGFGFRVSGFVDWNQLSLSVSGFGFRRLKPTFAVGFGFRVSGFVDWNQLSLSVSGFGFQVSSIETNFRCRFRVSGFVDWNQLSLSVSGFGFRRLKPTFAVGFGFRVSGFAVRNQL